MFVCLCVCLCVFAIILNVKDRSVDEFLSLIAGFDLSAVHLCLSLLALIGSRLMTGCAFCLAWVFNKLHHVIPPTHF